MKRLFLVSSLGTNIKIDGKRVPCEMDNSNGMVDILKSLLTTQNRLILISSNPVSYEINDEVQKITTESFKMSGFNFKEVIIIDQRNAFNMNDFIKDANLIFLCGGHVPTQNTWFKEIKLRETLQDYQGIIIGGSAGAMNCATDVYSCPELEGEALDSNFKRWIKGLDLTHINVFPHYNELADEILDGLKYIDDIVLKDSFKNPIYTLNDGSFIEVNNSDITIYGECSKIHNGKITKICDNHESIKI